MPNMFVVGRQSCQSTRIVGVQRAWLNTLRQRIKSRRDQTVLEKTSEKPSKSRNFNIIEMISAVPSTYKPVTSLNQNDIPRLAHGLKDVLNKKGVCFLKDPETSLYNYSQFLESIPPQSDFNYKMISPFIRPSEDQKLRQLALQHKKKFVASTSSITSALSQIYFVISGWKQADMSDLSKAFDSEPKNFTRLTTSPSSSLLKWNNGLYSLDSDSEFSKETILTTLGHSLERFLTKTPEEFAKYSISNGTGSEEVVEPLSYNYAQMEGFILRSQLDCYDESLPRKTFDLKTRAAVAIRMDHENYTEYEGYRIKQLNGMYESFEREYYDMVRAPMLKYNFQVRIGNMDGIFVAYHNTFRMYGFQYISMKEMDQRLFGNTRTGDQAFSLCVKVLSRLFQIATKRFPNQTLRITFNAKRGEPVLEVYVETVSPNEVASPRTPITTAALLDALRNPMGTNPFSSDYSAVAFGSTKTIPKKYTSQLTKFSLRFQSLVGNELVEDPVTLTTNGKEPWQLHLHLIETNDNPNSLRNEYNELRAMMHRRYNPLEEEENGSETVAKKLTGLIRKLRKLSQNDSEE